MSFLQIGLAHYLAVSALVFGLGTAIVICRRNAVAVLMGVEMILNAAALNFAAFARYLQPSRADGELARLFASPPNGQVIALFVIVTAAAEAAVALAIVLNFFNRANSVNVDEANQLRE